MYYLSKNKESGFTLIELLIAMTISLIILAAFSGVFLMQRRVFGVQEQTVEMVQNARAAMDMMTREIRMAGYDPTGTATWTTERYPPRHNIEKIWHCCAYVLLIRADLDGDGRIEWNQNEHIRYGIWSRCHPDEISRFHGFTDGRQPFAENIEAFTFRFFDSGGNLTTNPADIRQVEITITARTARPDPNYGGYRTHTLRSVITPRNLGL